MNTTPSNTNIEPRWRTYLKAASFLAPALFLWGIAGVFMFPKLKTIWRDAGFTDPSARTAMQASDFFMQHGLVIAGAAILILILLEWRFGQWPRYRRLSMGLVVFLLNSAVLVLITAMLMTALLAAPALLPRH